MGSLASEIGFDLKLFGKSILGGFLKDEMPAGGGGGGRTAKLEGFVRRLEEERRKIEAFKRELPLCMILLTDVIGGLKLELEQCESGGHVAEEFIPLKSKLDGGGEELGAVKVEKDKDKMDWMSSAQLWSDNCSDESVDCKRDTDEKIVGESDGQKDGEAFSLQIKRKSCDAGAFVPFKFMPASRKEEEKLSFSLPDLSLIPTIRATLSPATVDDDNRVSSTDLKSPTRTLATASSSSGGTHLGLQTQQLQQQPPRKARRCWSPELHRRFVIALQQLGGVQVATPKQIRELMEVDGLTNDEVKSHLQKYRLHTRRIPNASSSPVNRPVVTVGGLWVSQQDHCTTSQQSASQAGSPQGPLQLASIAQAISMTGGDSCEDDCKSESYSWK